MRVCLTQGGLLQDALLYLILFTGIWPFGSCILSWTWNWHQDNGNLMMPVAWHDRFRGVISHGKFTRFLALMEVAVLSKRTLIASCHANDPFPCKQLASINPDHGMTFLGSNNSELAPG